jgi:hypothetical protein
MSTKKPRIKLDNLRLFDKIDVGDVYYSNTTLLLRFNNVNTSSEIKDESKYTHNVYPIGDTAISTAKYKFDNSSLYLDGSGDYLEVASSEALKLSTLDFTFESWIYWTRGSTTPLYKRIFDSRPQGNSGYGFFLLYIDLTQSEKLRWYVSGANKITANSALPNNQWVHVAIVRASGITKMYIDGVAQAQTYTDQTDYSMGNVLRIGTTSYHSLGEGHIDGYLDQIRITKGIARYTANFDVPTKQFLDGPGDVNKQIVIDEEAKGIDIGEGGVDESRLAHAWVTFDGHNPATYSTEILDGYNISAIADVGIGHYIIYYNQPLNSSNSCVVGTVKAPDYLSVVAGNNPRNHPITEEVQVCTFNHTANSVEIRVNYGSVVNQKFDSERISVIVFSN